jgi:hypothetical protein
MVATSVDEFAATGSPSTRLFQTLLDGNSAQAVVGGGVVAGLAVGTGVGANVALGAAGVGAAVAGLAAGVASVALAEALTDGSATGVPELDEGAAAATSMLADWDGRATWTSSGRRMASDAPTISSATRASAAATRR